MLKIFNNLKPFFEHNYQRIHVREYAELIKVSPPTASKILEQFYKEGILKKDVDKLHHLYYANKDSELFKDLQQIYWKIKLQPLLQHIEEKTINPVIILFGSVAKAELKTTSDIDIAVFCASKKELNTRQFETKFKREIQLFTYKNLDEVPSRLKKNILNGKLLQGTW